MSAAAPDATVVICTRNRADRLAATLQGLRAARRAPEGAWELIVVDNGSTDRTPDLLARVRDLPLRVLAEPRPGKAHAANRGVAEARGALIAFTDDDVRVRPGWLDALLGAAERHPEATWFGGPVRPWWERPPPRWLEEGLAQAGLPWGLLDLGPEERRLAPHEKANGASLAVRAAAARRHPWDPSFGPGARRRAAGGETALQLDLERAGAHGLWVPGAAVEHWIPAETMTRSWIAFRYRLDGATQMRLRPSAGGWLRSLLALPFDTLPRLAWAALRRAPPGRRLRAMRRLHTHLGRVRGGLAVLAGRGRRARGSLPPPGPAC